MDFHSFRKILIIFRGSLQRFRWNSEPTSSRRILPEVIEAYSIGIPKITERSGRIEDVSTRITEHADGYASLVYYWARELIELLSESGNRWAVNKLRNSWIEYEHKVVPAMDLPT